MKTNRRTNEMFKRYVVDVIMENEDGSYSREETTRHTAQGLEQCLNRLRNNPQCVTIGVTEYDLDELEPVFLQ